MGFFYFVYVYVLGGITFIPLVIAAILLHAHFTLPHLDPKQLAEEASDGLRDVADEDAVIKSGHATTLDEKFKGKHDADVAEGYYAVCREYVPGGVNGKPPERTTPAGETIREESPSVYQSMYRSLFDRRQAPTLEPGKSQGRFSKRPRNVFYVVLRHGHLMLYDDENQSDVRHVISLAHHNVDLYGGGNEIPEGELWIKRNAIRLLRKGTTSDTTSGSKPFFFFSENCSDKEDFYHALLVNQEKDSNDPDGPPSVQKFDHTHMISLVQKLHASEEQFQTRWLNALLGRFFLGIYQTQFIEDVIRLKITKKISRVKKPDFLTGIILRSMDMGSSAPLITNPKLRDLTIDGNCCVEADVKYDGGVRVEIAATVRIDLGSRFKAREVQIVLAVTLKKLSGHMMVRFKPPPSNRIWMTFETMPKIEMHIEPIVSSRQITYTLILKAIESRIREVIAETLVLPYWDDIPFMDTEKQKYRGGIWEKHDTDRSEEIHVPNEAPEDEAETDSASVLDQSATISPSDERSASTPNLLPHAHTFHEGKSFFSRKGVSKQSHDPSEEVHMAASSGVEKRPEIPKTLRSTSSTAAPTVSTSSPDTVGVRHEAKRQDATTLMRELSSRSPPNSPPQIPHASASHTSQHVQHSPSLLAQLHNEGSSAPSIAEDDELSLSHATITDPQIRDPSPSASVRSKASISSSTHSTASTESSRATNLANLAKKLTPSEARQAQLAALSAAAANASRSWTWGRKTPKHSPNPSTMSSSTGLPGFGSPTPEAQESSGSASGTSTPHHQQSSSTNPNLHSNEPYGRGRPLPPPGQPLPPPDRGHTFASSAASLLSSTVRRKSVAQTSNPPDRKHSPFENGGNGTGSRKDSVSSTGSATEVKRRPVPPPPLPRRGNRAQNLAQNLAQQQAHHQQQIDDFLGMARQGSGAGSDIVVVQAPPVSASSDDEEDVDPHQPRPHPFASSYGEEEAEEENTDAIAEGGLPGEAAAELIEADLATPLARGKKIEARPAGLSEEPHERERQEGVHRDEMRKERELAELAAKESIAPADLESPMV